MKALARILLVLGLVFALQACGGQQQAAKSLPAAEPSTSTAGQLAAADDEPAPPRELKKLRKPAVAGAFYPGDQKDLEKMVDGYLDKAGPPAVKNLRGLISPHAGYPYSGPVAAFGYKLLEGHDFRTVVILAPSHRVAFRGASIPDADGYETPLGKIPISPKAAKLAKIEPFVLSPASGRGSPHGQEHSLEVQLPFLQRTLKNFSIVPIVFGRVDPEQVAKALEKIIDERTLIVASSDLTHYLPYDEANRLDKQCCEAICSGKPDQIEERNACGRGPILALMAIAKDKGWKARLLDYRNSGDTSGNKRGGVVGYASIAFYRPNGATAEKPAETAAAVKNEFSPAQRKYLLDLARKTVDSVVKTGKLPEVDKDDVPEEFKKTRACFVTLKKRGQLRGCIGSIMPREPLWESVLHMARSAATEDPRFRPVKPDELKDVHIEISVLTVPKELKYDSPADLLKKLRPNVDGVVLSVGRNQSTYLPQVWEQLPDKEEFLSHLSKKAGLRPNAWKVDKPTILVYQAEAFEEPEK